MLENAAIGIAYMPTNCFLSVEPLHGEIRIDKIKPTGTDCILNFLTGQQSWVTAGDTNGKRIKWVIIGAETGNRKGKVIPKREWIESIVAACRAASVPVFLKNNLVDIWGEPLIQEFPWGVKP